MSQNPFHSPRTLPHDSSARFRFPVLRTLGWYGLTTGSVFVSVIAGLSGVMPIFLVTFLFVATRERSLGINAIVVTAYWGTLAVFDLVITPPDAEPSSLDIAIAAAVHMGIQLAVCFLYPIVSRKLYEEREEMRGKD